MPLFIFLELATGEAIFSNAKQCFVLNTVCVTSLGLERGRLSAKVRFLSKALEIC